MATVTGFTAERMLEIENTTVVNAHLTGDHLVLETREGTEIDVGSVRGATGPMGPATEVGVVVSAIRTSMPGWLLMGTSVANCDTTWPDLWALDEVASWKVGTTLNLPVMSDMVVQGGGTLGAVTGSNTKTLLASNLPPHTHTTPNHTHPVAQHTHPIAHVHTMSHTHEHVHTHTINHNHGTFNSSNEISAHTHTMSGRQFSTAGNTGSVMMASATGTTITTGTSIETGTHAHIIDVPPFTGVSGGASDATTGQPSTPNTGNPSNANSGMAGPTVTGMGGAAVTGTGDGTSTPFDVQQKALRLNFFIYPGVAA
jgi:hypothetical protein